jgi:CheY-like chemotaxis protein
VKDAILIIEDNSDDIILLLAALTSLTNEKVVCRDAEEGLAYLERVNDPPTLILLDLGLPGMDGATFAYRVRHNDKTRHLPIVVITGDPDDEQRMFSLEVNAYLIKPLTCEALVRVVPRLRLFWRITHANM